MPANISNPSECVRGTIDNTFNITCSKCNIGYGLDLVNNACPSIDPLITNCIQSTQSSETDTCTLCDTGYSLDTAGNSCV